MLDERIPLRHGVIGQETQGPGGFFMALRSIHVMQGDPRRRRGGVPGRADLQLHEPGEHRRPGGRRPQRRPDRVAVRGADLLPRGDRRGRRARPVAARRGQRRAQPRLVERAPPLRRRGPAAAAARGLGAARRRPDAGRRGAPAAAPVDGDGRRCPAPTSSTTTSSARSSTSCRPSRRRAPRTSWAGCPDYWRHYEEQAQHRLDRCSTPDRSRGGIDELELAIDCMDAVFNDRGETLPVNVPNQGTVPGFPDGLVVETLGRCDREGIHPLPMPGLPTHLARARRGAGRLPAGRRRRRVVGRRARRRARAGRPPARALDRPGRAALRGDGRGAPGVAAGAACCRRA